MPGQLGCGLHAIGERADRHRRMGGRVPHGDTGRRTSCTVGFISEAFPRDSCPDDQIFEIRGLLALRRNLHIPVVRMRARDCCRRSERHPVLPAPGRWSPACDQADTVEVRRRTLLHGAADSADYDINARHRRRQRTRRQWWCRATPHRPVEKEVRSRPACRWIRWARRSRGSVLDLPRASPAYAPEGEAPPRQMTASRASYGLDFQRSPVLFRRPSRVATATAASAMI